MQIKVMGIDIGKSTFHVIGVDEKGNIALRKRFSRTQLLLHTANMPACLIGMEACCGAHYLGRALAGQGHEVRLMAGQYVRPFVPNNKNDFRDAEGISEAVQRPRMHFVPLKTDEQLDLQALHRVRDRFISQRTALINQIRGFLLDRGLAVPKGIAKLLSLLPTILEDAEAKLSPGIRDVLNDLNQECAVLNEQIQAVEQKIVATARKSELCRRLLTIPGVGPIIATAVVAAIGNPASFSKGRSFAAWIGLVPRQWSTGGKTTLLGIGKRGNPYLRKLFILGAQSLLMHMSKSKSERPYRQWLEQLAARAHRNVVVVALANKIARVAWAVLSKGEVYREALTVC